MRTYLNWLSRAWRWFRRGAGGYSEIPNVKITRAAVLNFQAAIATWSAAKYFTNERSVGRIAKITEHLFRRAVKAAPLWLHARRGLGNIVMYQGRRDEAVAQFARTETLRDELARAAGLDVNAKVFLPRQCGQNIGAIGCIDAFVKRKIMTGDPRPYYLLADPLGISNPAFLDYWSDYVTIVTDRAEIARLAKFEAVYGVSWVSAMPREGSYVHIHRGISSIQQQWSSERRQPLLALRQRHAELLGKYKSKLGMAETDWYICLHVRSQGFNSERAGGSEDFRNAPIEDYYPMIRALVAAGGWIIRMGDPSMPPLDLSHCAGSRQVVDYALSADRSAELDVALTASCRLFVGHSSGLHTIPHAFGCPCCLVNIPLNAGFPWHSEDLFIPKRYFATSTRSALSLENIFSSDEIINADNQFLLSRAGVRLRSNEPDDLLETVREALWPNLTPREQVADAVIAAFGRLNQKHSAEISGRLGRFYAAKYAGTLCPSL